MRKNIFIFLLLFAVKSFSQNAEIDSLRKALLSGKEDTNKVQTLNILSWDLIGIGNYDAAFFHANKSVTISQKIGYKKGQAYAYNNIGFIYETQGIYPEAIRNYLAALKIFEQIHDKRGIAKLYNNIGNVYYHQGNYPDALKNQKEALKIKEQNGFSQISIAASYNNIGNIFNDQGNYSEALKNHEIALKIREKIADKPGIAASLNNIGGALEAQGNYNEALKKCFLALRIWRETDNKEGMATALSSIGSLLLKQNEIQQALVFCNQSLSIARQIGMLPNIEEAEKNLSQIYLKKGDGLKAYFHYKAYVAAHDSILNQENTEKTVRSAMTYEFDKKQAEQKLEQEKKDEITKIIIYSGSGVLLIVMGFALFAYRSYRQKNKANKIITAQKAEVEHQRALVEEKNLEIIQSITYAKRLQSAILPPLGTIKKYVPESFVLYKPKDIVAGDFYWMETNQFEDENNFQIFLAAADCTGHGVPGAMVSMVCANALNRSVKEFKLKIPGEILDKTTELILETFEKSESAIKDGMDISLCSIDIKKLEVRWAGAHNPLRYISAGVLKEITADKQPVGMHENRKPFTTHIINLQKGDILYLFTDGFTDQFGGPEGKKFMSKRFKEILLSLQALDMNEQEIILNRTFEEWRGAREQVDDMLVMGVRV